MKPSEFFAQVRLGISAASSQYAAAEECATAVPASMIRKGINPQQIVEQALRPISEPEYSHLSPEDRRIAERAEARVLGFRRAYLESINDRPYDAIGAATRLAAEDGFAVGQFRRGWRAGWRSGHAFLSRLRGEQAERLWSLPAHRRSFASRLVAAIRVSMGYQNVGRAMLSVKEVSS